MNNEEYEENKNRNELRTTSRSKLETMITFNGFSDEHKRMKRNIIIISILVIFYKVENISINSSKIFGIKLEYIQEKSFDILLVSIIFYHLINLTIAGIITWQKWSKQFYLFKNFSTTDIEMFQVDEDFAKNMIEKIKHVGQRNRWIGNTTFSHWLILELILPAILAIWAFVELLKDIIY